MGDRGATLRASAAPLLWLAGCATAPARVPATPTPPPAAPSPGKVLVREKLNPKDPDAISSFLVQVRKALQTQGDGPIRVALVRQEDGE